MKKYILLLLNLSLFFSCEEKDEPAISPELSLEIVEGYIYVKDESDFQPSFGLIVNGFKIDSTFSNYTEGLYIPEMPFITAGLNEICVVASGFEAKEGLDVCVETTIDMSTEMCPDLFFEVEESAFFPNTLRPKTAEGTIEETVSWIIDGVFRGTSSGPDNAFYLISILPGTYEVCASLEPTDSCSEGVMHCKTIEISEPVENCPDLFFKLEEHGLFPNTFRPQTEDGIIEETVSWYIDGEFRGMSSGPGNAFSFIGLEPGSYEICASLEATDSCSEGVTYCETIEIEERVETCPDFFFELEEGLFFPNALRPQTEDGIIEETVSWTIDGVFRGISSGPDNAFYLISILPGTYEVCASLEVTTECPDGVMYCKEITIDP